MYVWGLHQKNKTSEQVRQLRFIWHLRRDGAGVWYFKGEEKMYGKMEKKIFDKQMFAMPCRHSGTQRGFWSLVAA